MSDFTPKERAAVATRTQELIEEEFPDRKPVAVALGDITEAGTAKPHRRRGAARQPATS